MSLLESYLKNHQELFQKEVDNVKKAMHKIEINDIESFLPEVQLQLEEYQAQGKTGYKSLSAATDAEAKRKVRAFFHFSPIILSSF